jgi:hypothetical protein
MATPPPAHPAPRARGSGTGSPGRVEAAQILGVSPRSHPDLLLAATQRNVRGPRVLDLHIALSAVEAGAREILPARRRAKSNWAPMTAVTRPSTDCAHCPVEPGHPTARPRQRWRGPLRPVYTPGTRGERSRRPRGRAARADGPSPRGAERPAGQHTPGPARSGQGEGRGRHQRVSRSAVIPGRDTRQGGRHDRRDAHAWACPDPRPGSHHGRQRPDDYMVLTQMQLVKFDGERWVPFGEIYDARKK